MKVLVWAFFLISTTTAGAKLNFVFIIVDDLRPTFGCYGDANAYTPNVDKLAKKSITFTQAFSQQSLCAPSRNSMLTSRRPDTLHLYDFYSYWRDVAGNFTTLPQHLKSIGYTTMSIGKVFHPGISSNGSDDSPYSWTEKPFHPFTNLYKNSPTCSNKNDTILHRNLICPIQVSMQPNKTLPDIETLHAARQFLKSQTNPEKPFFLAVGFQKPHVPFKYPKKFLKFHPLNKFQMANYSWPKNLSNVVYNPWNDIRRREDVKALNLEFPWQKIPVNFAKKIVQSYYSAVSYVDDLIGRLLDQLSSLNLTENTAVILTSDHGWSLGEHSEWAKYSNFDVALRVPLIMSIPGLSDIKDDSDKKNVLGKKCLRENLVVDEVVELIDLFPTIVNLAGDSIPICPSNDDLSDDYSDIETKSTCSEGMSLMPLITSSISCQSNTKWKGYAFSQYPRPTLDPSQRPNSDEPRLKDINIMGYTVRTKQFRYTAWVRFDATVLEANWQTIFAEELYDHETDPQENVNVAAKPEYAHERAKLKTVLQAGWRSKLIE